VKTALMAGSVRGVFAEDDGQKEEARLLFLAARVGRL